ncbi:MerR family transcriptional regulator [Candidatus Dependentiae bacterium]|nr:MAG: MerR family transcriptional regulator [Candidatus Dependentiae bacterium]
MKRKKGFYSISVVAKMFSVHQQTIRLYEKEGLISPKRTEGNTRLFSEDDVERLEEVINLTHKLGINLAGVEMILKLQKKIKKLQDDMNKLFSQTQNQMLSDAEDLKSEATKQKNSLLGIRAKRQLPKPTVALSSTEKETDSETEEVLDIWKIDYDE